IKNSLGSQIWWNGPRWLHQRHLPEEQHEQIDYDESQLEDRDKSTVVAVSACSVTNPFEKYSSFNRRVRIAATCLRFLSNCKKEKAYGPLTSSELEKAEKGLVRREQEIAFSEEINRLKKDKAILQQSCLKYLSPFLDEDHLLRVGGRLRNAQLSSDIKHPILLPHHSKLTEIIIEHEHLRSLHIGADATLAAVRQKYWPIRARGTVRRLLRGCIKCFRSKPRFSEQLMGDLPMQRVTLSRPFSSTGVDYCGPIYIREGSRRSSKRVKAFVAVFVCMATKATHLEVVSNLTTDAFLNAFKRFIARRGKPVDVFSDNGTNFTGANHELEELRALCNQKEHQDKILNEAANQRINWHFIPPRAPHFGGLWEATVKAFKRHFYKIVGETPLTFEEASTFVSQVEAVLNSRPLTAMSSDPNDMSYISAGHFLIGDALTSYPEPSLMQIQTNRLSRWQHLEQMRQHFWRRWSRDYLSQLQQRTKWHANQGPSIQVGQLVICREDGTPPLKWVLGRILDTFPGSDNI
ncbi:uncharacterized protein, partial [Mycetomoellerius zeteki]|uniref:uncharacterized protein n=1 Tax=Mycetomoellerius zeteki TaxID=64791 RepID=UPI00084EBB7D